MATDRPSRRPWIRVLITVVSLLAQLVGSMLLSEAVAAKSAAPTQVGSLAPLLYTEPAACAGCPSNVSLESAGVQRRAGSVLFDVHGGWPAAAARIPRDVRLVVDDLELVLRPPVTGDAFSVVRLTKATKAVAPTGVAVGLQGDALLVDLPSTLVATPLHFEFGLWSGTAYTGRLPRSGQLTWDGAGAPHPPLAPPPSTGRPSPPPSSPGSTSGSTTPGPGVTADEITALAVACDAIPTGRLPSQLAVTAVARGDQPPRGAAQPVPWVGVRFAAAIGPTLGGQPPFSATATLLPTGASPPSAGRPIDRVGTTQLWLWWDGSAAHRGARTFDGTSWHLRVDPADLQVDVSTRQIQFFSPLIGASDGYGFVVAASSGCEASAAPGRNPATGR